MIISESDDNIRKFLNQYADSARKICPEVPEFTRTFLDIVERCIYINMEWI